MGKMVRALAALIVAQSLAVAGPAQAEVPPITAKGQELARILDGMGVETRWIAGAHVDWRTGAPDDEAETLPGRHTHCSAFVAAAAKKLGVYILRPPQHGQALLANAQNEWLAEEGPRHGWRRLSDPEQAQSLANQGALVVASYHNHRDDKPGHIAIVRPAMKDLEQLRTEGPQVIQAGAVNKASISVREGFAGHPHAWSDNEIDYYAHEIVPE
jgi:hypothetical protein